LDVGHLRDVTPRKLPSTIEREFWIGPRDWRIFIRPSVVNGVAGASYPKARARSQLDNTRIIIEGVAPEIDAGRYPIKRVTGDRLEVAADIFRDGHEICAASLLLRSAKQSNWTAAPMQLHENDRWIGAVELTENCRHFYTIEAWRDPYASWLHATTAKYDAGQEISLELTEGRRLVAAAEKRANGQARRALADAAEPYDEPLAQQLDRLCAAEVQSYMAMWGSRTDVTRYRRELEVIVDRPAARFGAWYEMFPRSQGKWADRSATFADCIARLDDIAAMGFSVVYLPPIHPIGRTNRKGRNNAIAANPGDPGSPYAIGSVEGGHDAIAPELGTLADFRDFVEACRQRGMEVALDFAVQCSPDHPWIAEHPEWFEFRPDGSIRFAENPPKKYQDIVNLDLRADGPSDLWRALRDVVLFWIGQGVTIFRVDNPHTKPFAFWEWLIRDVQRERPDVIFLAEAFTRPKPLRSLAKLGFTQSYTYFTWRNSKQELVDYFAELTQTEASEYLRPQLFANTPDILSAFLQNGGPGAFRIRAALAATLSSLFGIYNGFELCEASALPESEEYFDSEKYEYKVWDWDRSGNIKPYIAALNRARMQNIALQDWRNLAFLPCDSDLVIFFVKWSAKEGHHVFTAISLDPHGPRSSVIELPLSRLGIGDGDGLSIANLLTGEKHDWMGPRQHVLLDPEAPAFLFTVTPSISRAG
jgi:starch synthase (maltosyl-transferring)